MDVFNILFLTIIQLIVINNADDQLHQPSEYIKDNADQDQCLTCRNTVDGYINYVRSGAPSTMLRAALYKLCIMYLDNSAVACSGMVDIEFETVLYIIKNKPNLMGEHVCAVYAQYLGCEEKNTQDWHIKLPPPLETHNYISRNDVNLPTNLTILHLTDIHFDPLYKPGSNANCNLPLCCQEESDEPESGEKGAGYWGDYGKCDIPWHSVLNLMDQITSQHKNIDYIYYTGDIISHIGWKTTKEGNTADIKKLFKLFKTTFDSIPVLPVLGNHEAHPTNFYSPVDVYNSNLTSQWVYDLVDAEWSRWLPKSTSKSIQSGGYYTMLLRPGLRIIGLNSNLCYTNNLWLVYEDHDPHGQLKWLVKVLYQAEKNGEYVHILSHVPPGDVQCHKTWNREFINIVNRFSKTIQAQFNGHTHMDEIRIFYDTANPKKVSNVAFNGASFTTYVGFNPNYRLYDVNSLNFEVTNYEEWIFNLTEANQHPKSPPRWYKLYSFLEDYSLNNLTRDGLGEFVERMANNDTMKYQYYRYLVRDSDYYIEKGCDKKCLDKYFCTITSVFVEDSLKC